MLWTWTVATAMSRTYSEVRDSMTMDAALYNQRERGSIEVAEVLSAICDSHGLALPSTDQGLLGLMARKAVRVDPATAPTGAVLQTRYGEVGYRIGSGVLEPLGDELAMVTMDPSRYVAAWLIPGISYFHEAATT